ncbi:MAG: CdaR family protein [Peptoniphilaceae bacterium]|nr:CdaR family protein [Peptoniphilaceae bacterium]MDD7383950.1 CdaR family protein [Peptoniphilaceae bacterium]MDY3738093.1 CdaR family protein [Peptoniphilaceae bacterium]
MERLKKDRKIKILSILASLVLWSYVMANTSPNIKKSFRDIELVVTNTDKLSDRGYTISKSDLENLSIDIEVEGERKLVNSLNSGDFNANVEFKDIREGTVSLPVYIDTPIGIFVTKKNPDKVNVKLEKIINIEKPVELNITQELDKNTILENTTASPNKILISGARSAVERVDKLICNIDDVSLLSSGTTTLSVVPVDSKGIKVSGVSLSQNFVNFQATVTTKKEVKVKLKKIGMINSLYKITKETVVPDKVVIKGSKKALEKINEVETEDVDIENITKNTTDTIGLKLPDNVVLDNTDGTVTYSIEVEKTQNTQGAMD